MKYEIIYDHPLVGRRIAFENSIAKADVRLYGRTGVIEGIKRIYKENWYDKDDEPKLIEEKFIIKLDFSASAKWQITEVQIPVQNDKLFRLED